MICEILYEYSKQHESGVRKETCGFEYNPPEFSEIKAHMDGVKERYGFDKIVVKDIICQGE